MVRHTLRVEQMLVPFQIALIFIIGTVGIVSREASYYNLPSHVRSALATRFQNASFLGNTVEVDNGRIVYEITIQRDGERVDVSLDSTGNLLEVETAVSPGHLPTQVSATIESDHPSARIVRAEQVVRPDSPIRYEVSLTTANGDSKVHYDATGKNRDP